LIKFQQVSEYSYNQELLFIDAILTTSESRNWMQHRTHKIIVVVKETGKLDTHAQVQAAQTGPGFFPLSLLAPGSWLPAWKHASIVFVDRWLIPGPGIQPDSTHTWFPGRCNLTGSDSHSDQLPHQTRLGSLAVNNACLVASLAMRPASRWTMPSPRTEAYLAAPARGSRGDYSRDHVSTDGCYPAPGFVISPIESSIAPAGYWFFGSRCLSPYGVVGVWEKKRGRSNSTWIEHAK
jgi:hypothetical protein